MDSYHMDEITLTELFNSVNNILEQSMYSDIKSETADYPDPNSVGSAVSGMSDVTAHLTLGEEDNLPDFPQLLQDDCGGSGSPSGSGLPSPVCHQYGTYEGQLHSLNKVIQSRTEQLPIAQCVNIIRPHTLDNAQCCDVCPSTSDFTNINEQCLPENFDDLDLALATVKAITEQEASVVPAPYEIKVELPPSEKKRKLTHTGVQPASKVPRYEKHTIAEDRRERRKESNRRAARKCREKKIKEQNMIVQVCPIGAVTSSLVI